MDFAVEEESHSIANHSNPHFHSSTIPKVDFLVEYHQEDIVCFAEFAVVEGGIVGFEVVGHEEKSKFGGFYFKKLQEF